MDKIFYVSKLQEEIVTIFHLGGMETPTNGISF